jgi:hypothetical protein
LSELGKSGRISIIIDESTMTTVMWRGHNTSGVEISNHFKSIVLGRRRQVRHVTNAARSTRAVIPWMGAQ